MISFIERLGAFCRVQSRMPYQKKEISEIANQGFPGVVIILIANLGEDIVAKAQWWGHIITYNHKFFGKIPPEMLERKILNHELIHCMLFQWKLGVAYKDPYYYRFHEAMAAFFSKTEPFHSFLDEVEKDYPGGVQNIFRYALIAKKMPKDTGAAKDYACEAVTDMDWKTMRETYMAKAEAVLRQSYPRDKLPETAMRYEDYKRLREKEEKEEKEAEKKAEKTEKKPGG